MKIRVNVYSTGIECQGNQTTGEEWQRHCYLSNRTEKYLCDDIRSGGHTVRRSRNGHLMAANHGNDHQLALLYNI